MANEREFQVFAKPGGAVCNLDCSYCYYLEKQELFPSTNKFKMAIELLEEYIIQQIKLPTGKIVRFSWHGGEPTLLGVDYFRQIVELQKKHAPSTKQVVNGVVTNGTLLDDEWCRFLSREGFTVGLSIDGPADLHDAYRVSKNEKPTHEKVMRGLSLIRQHNLPCDILCVVHDRNVKEPLRTYQFFKEIGATFVGFLPLVERSEHDPNRVSEHTVSAADYGLFLSAIFDEWIRNDIGKILIQNFDEAARPVRGLEHALCIFREACGDIPALEHNGDLFSCDHFVDEKHRLGNIRDSDLTSMLSGSAHVRFGQNKRDLLPRYCLECDVLDMCNGGCPKDRILSTPDREPGLNYLCQGFKRFFTHCRPVFEALVPIWKAGAAPDELMAAARGERLGGQEVIGRNEPCPCGSGKKFKRCCMHDS